MKKILFILFGIVGLYGIGLCINTLHSFYGFAKGVQEDCKKQFVRSKQFMHDYSFCGAVVSKKYYEKREIGKYQLTIHIKHDTTYDNLIDNQHGSYYQIKRDSLFLAVPKSLFESVREGDTLTKSKGNAVILTSRRQIEVFSDSPGEWCR